MSIISKLVKIATDLDKYGKYEEADAVTHVAERLTVEAGIRKYLTPEHYPETAHDPGPLGYNRYNEPTYEEEIFLGHPEPEEIPEDESVIEERKKRWEAEGWNLENRNQRLWGGSDNTPQSDEDDTPDLGTGEDLYFTPTQEQQIAWEPAEGGYPIYRGVPYGEQTWRMKPSGEHNVLEQARKSRDLLDRYYRMKGSTLPGEFASDEEGTFGMPSSPGREKPPVYVTVTKGRPYSTRGYEGYS